MAPIRSLAEGGSFDPVVLDRLTDILDNIWIEVGHTFAGLPQSFSLMMPAQSWPSACCTMLRMVSVIQPH